MESEEILTNKDMDKKAEKLDLFNEEVVEAADKLDKMNTMIHRFPEGLGDISYQYIVPRVVTIGPYHHGKEDLKKMEVVKKAAACFFCRRFDLEPKEAYKKVHDAKGNYIAGESIIMMDDDYFAAMMFHDACFLLVYMDAYSRSFHKYDAEMNPALRRVLFSKRDGINKDIMLLENQLPWQVVQAVMGFVPQEHKKELMMAVGNFIADMGDTFSVTEHIQNAKKKKDEENPLAYPLALRQDEENPQPHPLPLLQDEENSPAHLLALLQDEENPPPHILALLRENVFLDDERYLKKPACSLKKFVTPISPMELEEIGITLTANQTGIFTDMDLEEGWLLGKISLAPLSLSDIGASLLVNMAAFEVCTASSYEDHPNNTTVCSYFSLLSMLMVRKEDVHRLRSKGLLYGPHSNKEMLTFFNMMHLPDSGSHFAHLRAKIEEYKHKRYIQIKLYKWLYNNYKYILAVLPILGTLIGLYRAILPLNEKN